MFARIAPLVASAAFALLAHGAAWSADSQPASPSTPASTQPAVASPVAPTLGAAASGPAAGAPLGAKDSATAAVAPPAGLDDRIQELKGDVIRLNRDLLVLEEELLFPASTQVALFVSMDVGKLFDLDSVQIKLDDKVVTNYLYTPLEVQALHRGGVQRAYLGNLKAGSHEIVAFFTGKGPHDRDYKRGTTVKFDKGTDPKYIELRIKDSTGKLQPEFEVKVWQ
ncbi:MAG TPA: AraC family transcriptional regulator [Burkholderiaceae bacterium]|nr:AraC family transcriptional regulator [Burkholderiaceae bacterium]HSC00669.1 AraC family transcriptional regulator [Burkholderiaceae bacterium]